LRGSRRAYGGSERGSSTARPNAALLYGFLPKLRTTPLTLYYGGGSVRLVRARTPPQSNGVVCSLCVDIAGFEAGPSRDRGPSLNQLPQKRLSIRFNYLRAAWQPERGLCRRWREGEPRRLRLACRVRQETETVIVLNGGEEFAIVDTMHGRFRRACERIIQQMGRELHLDAGRRSGKKFAGRCVSRCQDPRGSFRTSNGSRRSPVGTKYAAVNSEIRV
jgi:hypothetical protein